MAEQNGITVKIGAETDGIEQGIRQIQTSLKNIEGAGKTAASGFDTSFAKMAGAVAVGQAAFEAFKSAATMGLSAVTGAIGSLASSFTSAIDAAAQMETLETAFVPLLGSAEAAQARIEELAKFAAETPFEMPEIAAASKTLETLTRGALSTADGLRLVGDVASATNTPFEEISTTVGRLYDGLQSGRPVGEVMQRLQELGAVSGETRSQIEALSKEGKNTEAWLVAEEALNRFSGSMKLQSGTWSGLLSTLSDNVTQALAKFGEPILDRLKPYLQGVIAVVELLAEKAVTIGTAFAENFIASSDSAKTFQKAIDAISAGKVEAGFKLFWENLKLQAMETGNAIYKYLTAAFQTAVDAVNSIFGKGSGFLTAIVDQFEVIGMKSAKAFAEAMITISPMVNKALTQPLKDFVAQVPGMAKLMEAGFAVGEEAQKKVLESMRASLGTWESDISEKSQKAAKSFEDFSTKAKGSFASIPKEFQENLSTANDELFKTSEQLDIVAAAEAEVAAQTQATNDARGDAIGKIELTGTTLEKIAQAEGLLAQAVADGNTQLAERLQKNLKVLESQAEAERITAKEQAARTELITLETDLNNAKAAGNEELAKAIEKELEQKKAKEEIKKLTEKYVKTLGVDADEAGRLAQNFVNAKNAANSIGDRSVSVTITTTVDDTRWKNLLAELAANEDPKAVQVALQVTGEDKLENAYQVLQNMETVQKNFTVALDVIGAKSLEEAKQNLEGIPTQAQKQLAFQLTGETDLEKAITKLDSVPLNKKTQLLLEKQGFDNVDDLQSALKGIPDKKRTDLFIQALGLEDADQAVKAIDRILANDGKKAAVTVEADTSAAEQEIDDLDTSTTVTVDADTTPAKTELGKLGSPVSVPIDADTSAAQAKIAALAGPVVVKVDTSQVQAAIAQVQADIQNSFTGGAGGDGGIGGQGGQGGAGGNATADMSTLQTVVTEIKGFVETLTKQLPTPALV